MLGKLPLSMSYYVWSHLVPDNCSVIKGSTQPAPTAADFSQTLAQYVPKILWVTLG